MNMKKPNRLRELRKKAGLSQTELADAIHFAQSMISGWENNTKKMSLEQATMLAEYFNVSVGYLAGDDIETEQPTAENDSELRKRIIDRVKKLPDPALEHTWAYLEGLRVGQEIAPAKPVDRDSGSVLPE